jgi:CheY-like chemotaxis protein
MARILLAEDDPTMVRLLGTLLRMEGYEVTSVDGDTDLPGSVEQLAPDALILDMVFARQNGLQVVERVRKGAIGAKLYVLMMSGLSVREDCLRRGAGRLRAQALRPRRDLALHTHVRTRYDPDPHTRVPISRGLRCCRPSLGVFRRGHTRWSF